MRAIITLVVITFLAAASASASPLLLSASSNTAYTGAEFRYRTIRMTEAKAADIIPLQEITARYEDRDLSLKDLQELADRLTQALIAQGYFLSRAEIPGSNLAGDTLTIRISEGYLSAIRFADTGNEQLRSVFREVMAERPATYESYQRALLQINAIPGYQIREYRQVRDPAVPDGYIAELDIRTTKAALTANLSNRGQRNGEEVKAYLGLSLHSVLRKGDVLRTGFITKPQATDEFRYYSVRYDAPFRNQDTRVFVESSYSETRPITALADRNLAGETFRAGAGIRKTLIRELHRRLWVEARFDVVNAREEEDLSRLYNDRLRVVRALAGLTHVTPKRAVTSVVVEASQGLDAFNATGATGAGNSRPDANARFTKVVAEVHHHRPLSKYIFLNAGGIAQASDSPLLFSEEFSLGGGTYGRGYDFGEILGDNGVAGFVELGYGRKGDGILDKWEAYGFIDSGAVWNEAAGLSIDGDFLSSAGLGLRLDLLKNFRVAYEAAYPMSDAPFTQEDGPVRHRLDLTLNVER